MPATKILIHLPAHRARALQLQTEHAEAERAYDENITAYIAYLKDEAQKAGYVIETDKQEAQSAIVYDGSHAQVKAAHDWLETLPDLWNWIP